jgi:hypothetical protein
MNNQVSFAEFIVLLQQLENSGTGIRLRLSGKTWTSFYQLILLSESAMMLRQGNLNQIVNLRNVLQFEIEEAVADFQPHIPYEIIYY